LEVTIITQFEYPKGKVKWGKRLKTGGDKNIKIVSIFGTALTPSILPYRKYIEIK